MKHTNGPWKAALFDNGGFEIEGVVRTGSMVVAARNGYDDWEYAAESQANGRLIAAAPELLEALELCASVLAGHEMSKSALTRALEKAAAAMKKAKGTEDPK